MTSARQAHARARPGRCVLGWKLDPGQRQLLERFPPRYEQPVADHVTLKPRVSREALLPEETGGTIVGRVDDGQGVEALVVSIGGTTGRPDGSIYHITWSLAPGRGAKESNDVLARQGWQPVEPPIEIGLQPQRFP